MSDNVVNRESTKMGLADRYLSQKAGGAYNVQSDVKTNGANEKSLGGSSYDTNYTNTKGFKIKMQQGETEFKDVKGNNSSELSLKLKGFNNKKYSDGSFSR